MKTNAEIYYQEIELMYKSSKQRKAFAYPEWTYELGESEFNKAKKAVKGVQAFLLMLLDKNKQLKMHYKNISQLLPTELIEKTTFLRVVASSQDEPKEYVTTLKNVEEYARFESEQLINRLNKSTQCTFGDLYELITEALDRNARVSVPIDVAGLMQVLVGAQEAIDVYSKNGIGLLSALRAREECQVHLVDVDEKIEEIKYESNHKYVDRLVERLEIKWNKESEKSDCLLINALDEHLPLYPKVKNEETGRTVEGSLNAAIEKHGYRKIGVLVSNSVLSGNRGEIKAQEIFDYCVKNGLRKVVQLPPGAVGQRNTEDSILIFEKNYKEEEIQFIVLPNGVDAIKKFGLPRRASEYEKNLDYLKNLVKKADKKTYKYIELKNKKALSSFQAGSHVDQRNFYEQTTKLEMRKIGELYDIIRAQHISSYGEETSEIEEVSSSNIDETGIVEHATKKEVSLIDLEKYSKQILQNGDVLICFRGSPEAVGKVGLYIHEGKKVVPNQSFMILRPKLEVKNREKISKITFWWLRTTESKIELRKKSLSPGVLRLTPTVIKEFSVPCGPEHFIDSCMDKLKKWLEKNDEIREAKQEAKNIENAAFEKFIAKN